MLRSVIATVHDNIFPPDPGSLRFRAALRATLSGLLTFGAVLLIGDLTSIPISDRILGFVMGLFTSATVRDPSKAQQATTMSLVPLVASVATTIAALLVHHALLAAVLIPCIVFAVVYGGGRGPRWGAFGAIGLISYTIGLITRLPLDTLPSRILIICVGVASAALVRFILLPDSPTAELRRLRRDIERSLSRLLASVDVALAAGAWTREGRRGLQRQQDRLRTMILLAEARIWVTPRSPPGLGLHLLEIELAAEGVVRAALHDLGPPDERSRLQADLAALRTSLDGLSRPATQMEHRSSLGQALVGLTRTLHEPMSAGPDPQAPRPLVTSGIRPAIQAVVATALAVIAGELISPQRWYWAAFAAFVMFQGTRSRGESLAKELQFMAGTLAGVFAGVLFSTVLHGHQLLTMAVIIAAVFLAWQASLAAYAVMVFWITVILGLVFGLLGYFSPALLLLRLEESAVGAACGILVAYVVMTRPTRDFVDATTTAVLRALAQSIEAAAALLLGQPRDRQLPSALIEVESRLADLRAAVSTELQGLGMARHDGLRRRVLLLEACATWARKIGRISLDGSHLSDLATAAAVRKVVRQIEWRVVQLTNGGADTPLPDGDGGVQGDANSNASDIVRHLRLIDLALVRVATTMTVHKAG